MQRLSFIRCITDAGLGALSTFGVGVVNGLSGLLSGKAQQRRQYKYNSRLQRENYEYNSALAEQSFERQMNFWRRHNEYNSPAHQRELREQAGLSPYALNGQMVTPSQGLSPVASGNTSGTSVGMSNFAPQVDNPAVVAAQIRNLDSQTELNKSRSKESGTQSDLNTASAELMRQNFINAQTQNGLDQIALRFQEDTFSLRKDLLVNEISRGRQTLRNLVRDGRLKDFELQRQPVINQQFNVALHSAQASLALDCWSLELSREFGRSMERARLENILVDTKKKIQERLESQGREEYFWSSAVAQGHYGRLAQRRRSWLPVQAIGGLIRDVGVGVGGLMSGASRLPHFRGPDRSAGTPYSEAEFRARMQRLAPKVEAMYGNIDDFFSH